MTDEEALRRAEQARQALDTVTPILDAMRAEVHGAWISTAPTDTATREKMFLAYSTVNSVERALKSHIENGQYVRHAREMVELTAKVANG